MREREGLIARIRQIRRTAAATATPPPEPRSNPETRIDPDAERIRALASRVDHLEQLLEALQDQVHREAERQSRRITELDARTQPAALGVALSRDARERGL